jgi:hypothetical protein
MNNGNRPQATSAITFAAVPTAISCARLFVNYTLRQWRLEALIDSAELLVSELVTSAVKMTGVVERSPKWSELTDLALIYVRLLVVGGHLIIEVWDRDAHPPVLQTQSIDAEGGRGLYLVDQISKRWNFYNPPRGGKVVWCELELPPAPLPKRKPTPRPWPSVPPESSGPSQYANDPETMRRVRDGLEEM